MDDPAGKAPHRLCPPSTDEVGLRCRVGSGQKKIRVEEGGKIGERKSRDGWEESNILGDHIQWPRILEKEKPQLSSRNRGASSLMGFIRALILFTRATPSLNPNYLAP